MGAVLHIRKRRRWRQQNCNCDFISRQQTVVMQWMRRLYYSLVKSGAPLRLLFPKRNEWSLSIVLHPLEQQQQQSCLNADTLSWDCRVTNKYFTRNLYYPPPLSLKAQQPTCNLSACESYSSHRATIGVNYKCRRGAAHIDLLPNDINTCAQEVEMIKKKSWRRCANLRFILKKIYIHGFKVGTTRLIVVHTSFKPNSHDQPTAE